MENESFPRLKGLHVRRCEAGSPCQQSITSLASFGGGTTASKLPIGLEGKTGDQIARCSTVLGRVPWGGSPTMADHSV